MKTIHNNKKKPVTTTTKQDRFRSEQEMRGTIQIVS